MNDPGKNSRARRPLGALARSPCRPPRTESRTKPSRRQLSPLHVSLLVGEDESAFSRPVIDRTILPRLLQRVAGSLESGQVVGKTRNKHSSEDSVQRVIRSRVISRCIARGAELLETNVTCRSRSSPDKSSHRDYVVARCETESHRRDNSLSSLSPWSITARTSSFGDECLSPE